MTTPGYDPVVTIALRESTVALLIKKLHRGETLDQVIERAALAVEPLASPDSDKAPKSAAACAGAPGGKATYQAEILGERLEAQTMGALFAKAVDVIDSVAPEAIEELARMRARRRKYVAREPGPIHAGRTDLRTLRSRSGWWVSANIGEVDLRRGLKVLCLASGLRFGFDVRFWRRE